jgi:hypothetical protein
MILEARCPQGSAGQIVEGATFVLAAKPVQFPSINEFKQQLGAAFKAAGAAQWHVAAVGCPGDGSSQDCSRVFTVVLSAGSDSQPIALTYTTGSAPGPQLIAAAALLPDAPALRGGEMQVIYLDGDAALTGVFWFMPWEPKTS